MERNFSAWSKGPMGEPGLQAGPHSGAVAGCSPATHRELLSHGHWAEEAAVLGLRMSEKHF